MSTGTAARVKFAAVAIGRNEGERLNYCLGSLRSAARVVYIDSGSDDCSVQRARNHGVDVVELDPEVPFTAARARNVGFKYVCQVMPDVRYVQFIDGDCELDEEWPTQAVRYLETYPEVAAVCGRRRERFPEKSIYNWLCDVEWNVTPGEVRAFAGDVMIRATALQSVGGHRDDLIAGEESELCVRLRGIGWRIWRLDAEMVRHDAAMTKFGQWWRRAMRSGYAFSQGAHLHGAPPERHWVWESRRAWFWGAALPFVCIILSSGLWPWGLLSWLVYPLQVLRQTIRNSGPLTDRATIALFQVLARFPEALGQLKFQLDRTRGTRATILEYK